MDDWFYSKLPEGEDKVFSPHAPPSDDRRQAIVVASYHLIVEKGFAGFRVRDAAQRAGITAATLYYYFPTKEALVQAVDNYLTLLIVERQLQWSTSESTSPSAQLHAHLAGIQHLLQHDPSIFIALHELYLRSLRDPKIQQIVDTGEQGWHAYVAAVLQAGVAQQQFRADLDPASAAWVILSFIKGLNVSMSAPQMAAALSELETWLGSQGER